jgi:hypothetical protein
MANEEPMTAKKCRLHSFFVSGKIVTSQGSSASFAADPPVIPLAVLINAVETNG